MENEKAAAAAANDLEKELSSLRKLWLILALVCMAVSINVLLATQGGAVQLSVKAALGLEFDKDIPEAIAGLWGVVYLTIFIGFASAVVRAHACKSPGGWAERFPFRIFDLPMGRGVGLSAQCIALVILTLWPAYMLAHSWKTMLKHGVLCVEVRNGDWRPRAAGDSAFFTRPVGAEAGATRLTSREGTPPEAGQDAPSCKDNQMTDYWAPGQSWLMAALSLFSMGMLGWSLLAVFRPARPARTDPPTSSERIPLDRGT